jgi:hypothetical protein
VNMMVMIFACKEAREQLLKRHMVATLRAKPHKVGKDWATDARGHPKLVDVAISLKSA